MSKFRPRQKKSLYTAPPTAKQKAASSAKKTGKVGVVTKARGKGTLGGLRQKATGEYYAGGNYYSDVDELIAGAEAGEFDRDILFESLNDPESMLNESLTMGRYGFSESNYERVSKISDYLEGYNQRVTRSNYLNKLLKQRREADLNSLVPEVATNRRASLVAGLQDQGSILG